MIAPWEPGSSFSEWPTIRPELEWKPLVDASCTRPTVYNKLNFMGTLNEIEEAVRGSRRPNLTHSEPGLPNLTPQPGTAKCKRTLPRDAWTRLRTKPSKICGLAVAQIGEAPRQSGFWAVLSPTFPTMYGHWLTNLTDS